LFIPLDCLMWLDTLWGTAHRSYLYHLLIRTRAICLSHSMAMRAPLGAAGYLVHLLILTALDVVLNQ